MSWRQGSPPPTSTIPELEGPPPPAGVPPTGLPPAPPPGGAPPLATWRKVVLGVIIVVLVGGLAVMLVRRSNSGDDQAAAPPPAAAPQTTAVTSPAQSDQPPVLVNTGEDWPAIVRSIQAYHDWLARHPNPELLSNIYHPTNPSFVDSQNALAKLASGEWHYVPVPSPHPIERVVLTSRLGGKTALLFVWFGPTPAGRILDRAGNVINNAPPTVSHKGSVTLIQDDNDPRWRVGTGDSA